MPMSWIVPARIAARPCPAPRGETPGRAVFSTLGARAIRPPASKRYHDDPSALDLTPPARSGAAASILAAVPAIHSAARHPFFPAALYGVEPPGA